MDKFNGADRLAYECARQIRLGKIDARSGIGDALLDYLHIGGIDGPSSVPEWMRQYDVRQAINEAEGKEV